MTEFPEFWQIIPVAKKKKKPPIVATTPYQDRNTRYPRDQLKRKLEQGYNCCVLTGKCSADGDEMLLGIDFDGVKDGFMRVWKDFKNIYPRLAKTRIQRSPSGGIHLFYNYKGKELRNNQREFTDSRFDCLDHIDIRGEGGYILIEPSVLENGIYEVLENEDLIAEIDEKDYWNIIKFFIILEDKSPKVEKKVTKKLLIKGMRSEFRDILEGRLDIVDLMNVSGKDKHVYYKYVCIEALINGFKKGEILGLLQKNQSSFDFDKCVGGMKTIKIPYEPMTKKMMKEYFPDYINKDEHVEIIVAKDIIDKHKIFTFEDSGEFTIYEDGKYINPKICKFRMKKYIGEVLHELFPSRHLSATLGPTEMEIRIRTLIDPAEFDNDPNIINCLNGYYNTETNIFTEHNDENPLKTFIQIPINYNPDAECPKIDKFIYEVVGDEFKDIMYAFIGYVMLPTVKYQRAILLQGDGSNGKSTLIDLIKNAVGLVNCESIALQFLRRRFQKIRLRGKLFNALGDISNQKIEFTSDIKDVIAERTLSSDIKNYEAATWINTTKHMFSCNDPPIPYDDSHAFWRRWFYIECKSKFEGKTKDPNKLDELITPDELSGLLNKAIIGIAQLDEQGGFTDEYTEWVRNRWTRKLRPLDDFITNSCYIGENYWCDKMEFVEAFNDYWTGEGYEALSITRISRLLGYYKVKVMRGSRRAGSNQEYKGITWKDKIQMDDKEVVRGKTRRKVDRKF